MGTLYRALGYLWMVLGIFAQEPVYFSCMLGCFILAELEDKKGE